MNCCGIFDEITQPCLSLSFASRQILQEYSLVSIKRTGCNKRTGGKNSPKIVKRTGCIKQTGWTFCQK